jgi:hypothetical protein
MRSSLLWSTLAVFVLLAACGSTPEAPSDGDDQEPFDGGMGTSDANDASNGNPGEDASSDAGVDSGPECVVAETCPGVDTTCRVRTCVSGACGTRDVDQGTTCEQTKKCDGAGACVECVAPANCEVPTDPCREAACTDHVCGSKEKPNDTPCNDNSVCTQTDTCQAGQCTGASPVVCVAPDDCHDVSACDAQLGCSYPAKADGALCSIGKCLTGVCTPTVVVLAIQDFEAPPAAPTWTLTGAPDIVGGFSAATAAPAESPLGIGGSKAWHTFTNSGGKVIDFDNVMVPAGFARVRLTFRLAAMNLLSTGGGPDNLDYVLLALSVDGGANYYNRVRIRGALNDNSYWGYDATGIASVNHLPQTEAVFQPTASGLATTLGYSTVDVLFPGTVTQVRARITARSSSSTDSWLIDNVTLVGERDIP